MYFDGKHNFRELLALKELAYEISKAKQFEAQETKHVEFAKRMFVYNYRLFDGYDRP